MSAARLSVVLAVLGVSAAGAGELAPFSGMALGEVAGPWRTQSIRGRSPASFRIIDVDGGVVEAAASGSVASLIHPVNIEASTGPTLSWRWRILDTVETSDLYRKSGDDFAVRVYVLFDVDPGKLPFGERWKLRIARLLYGAWVPAAALCYVAANGIDRDTIAPNAYTGRVRMIVVDAASPGGWRSFERDVASDYRSAFEEPAPGIIGIAIAIDTDDTGESARAWFGDLRLVTDTD